MRSVTCLFRCAVSLEGDFMLIEMAIILALRRLLHREYNGDYHAITLLTGMSCLARQECDGIKDLHTHITRS